MSKLVVKNKSVTKGEVTKVSFQDKIESEKYKCSQPQGHFTQICTEAHIVRKILRCHDCDGCYNHRVQRIRFDMIRRLENSEVTEKEVILWTAGSNWSATPENYEKIKRAFDLFRKYIRKKSDKKINIYFRVYEAGSQGRKLHVHFITDVYAIDWADSKEIWEKYLKEQGHDDKSTNYNYKRVKRCKHCKKVVDYYKTDSHCGDKQDFEKVNMKSAILYMCKYLTKEYSQSQNNEFELKRNYYIGKPLWYKEQKIKDETQYNVNMEKQESERIYKKPNSEYRREYYLKRNISALEGVREIEIELEEKWIDKPVLCDFESDDKDRCGQPVVIKALEFVQNPVSNLYEKFGSELGSKIWGKYIESINDSKR